MKIAYVYDAIYPYVKGGVEKRIHELAARYVEAGHEVHLFGLNWWGGSESLVDGGLVLHGVAPPPQSLYVNGRRSITEALSFGFRTLAPLLKEGFDIIDCQHAPYFSCFSSKIASLLKKEPLLITWHEVWNEYWYEYLGRAGMAGREIERIAARLTNHQVAVSESTRRDLRRLCGSSSIEVIPNGIDFERIQKIPPAPFSSDVIYAGRLIKEKHIDLLLKAVRIVADETPDLRCLIVGDGPEMAPLRALTRQSGLRDNVFFTGFVEAYDDLIGFMRTSKVFALPSTREGFGIVALEANAVGLPVITVDHPMNAARDLITPETGRISALNPESFATEIVQTLERPPQRSNCIEQARGYDWDRIALKLEQHYAGVAG